MPQEFAEIGINSGALTQALTTTAGQIARFSGVGGFDGQQGDGYVRPDRANNRLLVLPGFYFVHARINVTGTAEANITLRLRKNSIAYSPLFGSAPQQMLFKQFTPTLSPAAVAQATSAEQDLTVTGLLTTDRLLTVTKPTSQAGLGIGGARIKSANTLAVNFYNVPAGGNITPTAAQVYQVEVARFGLTEVQLSGILPVVESDSPGNIKLFAEPTNVNAGVGGAPSTMIPLDLTLESDANTTVTISSAIFSVLRLS